MMFQDSLNHLAPFDPSGNPVLPANTKAVSKLTRLKGMITWSFVKAKGSCFNVVPITVEDVVEIKHWYKSQIIGVYNNYKKLMKLKNQETWIN